MNNLIATARCAILEIESKTGKIKKTFTKEKMWGRLTLAAKIIASSIVLILLLMFFENELPALEEFIKFIAKGVIWILLATAISMIFSWVSHIAVNKFFKKIETQECEENNER